MVVKNGAASCRSRVVALVLAVVGLAATSADVAPPERLGVLFLGPPGLIYSRPEVYASFLWAVAQANASTTLLPRTRVEADLAITYCTQLSGVDAVNGWDRPAEQRAGIVGPACSDMATGASYASWGLKTAMLSYSATSKDLSDKSVFPLFSRAMASDGDLIVALVAALDALDYASLGVIYDIHNDYYNNLYGDLVVLASDRLRFQIPSGVAFGAPGDDVGELIDASFAKLRATWAETVASDSGGNVRVWCLFVDGDMFVTFIAWVARAYPETIGRYVFLTSSTFANYHHSLADAANVLYVDEVIPDLTRFSDDFKSRLPARLRSSVPAAFGDGAATWVPHSYAAYAHDSTTALLRAVDAVVSAPGYAGGAVDGLAVAAALRNRTIPDAYSGVWSMDASGDMRRTFKVVHCAPTRGRNATGPGYGCESAFTYDSARGIAAARAEPAAGLPPGAFAPVAVRAVHQSTATGEAVAWRLDPVADLRGAAVTAVDVRVFAGGGLVATEALPTDATHRALLTSGAPDPTGAPRAYNATCASVRVTTSGGRSPWSNQTCTRCVVGYESDAGMCRPCAAGTFGVGGVSRCRPCAPGTAARAAGAYGCDMCGSAEYQPAAGAATCLACPRNARRFDGDAIDLAYAQSHNALADCACARGSYASVGNATGVACFDCPAMGVCPGGTAAPYLFRCRR